MIDVLLPVVLFIGIVTLAIAIGTLRSSRRSENLGEDRYELLRSQHDWLEALREERTTLTEALQRESSERQKFMEALGSADPQVVEDLKRERQGRIDDANRARLQERERARLEEELERVRREHQEVVRQTDGWEQLKKQNSGIKQEAERLSQERQRLAEELETEHGERVNVQRQAERQEEVRARLEAELRQAQAELDRRERTPDRNRSEKSGTFRSRRRRPLLVVGLLVGGLIVWFTSLMVALNVLAS